MKLTGLLIAALLVAPSLASAQVYSYVESPSLSTIVSPSALKLTGWVVNCATGQQPPILQAAYFSGNGAQWVPMPVTMTWRLLRPDVRDVFVPYCSNLKSPHLGFQAQLNIQAPPTIGTPPTLWIRLTWEDVQADTKIDYLQYQVSLP